MKVTIILPHPNRHYYDPFKTLCDAGSIDLSYVFLKEQPHYRKNIDWSLPDKNVYQGFNLFTLFNLIRNSDIVVLGGIIHPKVAMPFIFMMARLLAKKTVVATEEVSFKKINNPMFKFLFSFLFDSKKITCLAIGNRVKHTYNSLGVYDWNFRKFGCFENKKCVKKTIADKGLVRILAVGSLVENKNHEIIIKALSNYDGAKKVELNIAGDGPLKDHLANLSVSLPKNITVKLHGMCSESELSVLYSNADLFIHPSLRDRWGATVSQAIDNSLPIIISNRVGSGTGFLLQEGFNGYSFNGFDDFSVKLFSIINDNKLLDELSKNACLVSEIWGHDSVCNNLLEFLHSDSFDNEDGPLSTF